MEKTINIVIDNKITSLVLIGDNPDNLINVNDLITCINDILANTYKYDKNLFENTRIEIYQPNYNKSANYPYPFKNNDVAYVWGSKNLMQFRADVLNTLENMSQCFSHEFGHLKASKAGYDNTTSLVRKKWDQIRGRDITSRIGAGELFAEDIRMFQGSRLAKDVWRTDQEIPHKNPTLIPGLKLFYELWKPTQDLINEHSKIGEVKNLNFYNSDTNYFEFRYDLQLPFNPIVNTFKVDKIGIWQWEFTGFPSFQWKWNLKRTF